MASLWVLVTGIMEDSWRHGLRWRLYNGSYVCVVSEAVAPVVIVVDTAGRPVWFAGLMLPTIGHMR
jgi:hypothetical protein